MSKKRFAALVVGTGLLIVVIPVVIAQLRPSANRALTGIRLSETAYQEVHFRNEQQDIDLAGMLFVPEGSGPHPAAVIIHGSGTSRRDNRWYLTLVDHLVSHGITVLLPDKRGSEQSGGQWRTSSFEDLATDTLAAISYLKSHDSANISQIGIIGLSQGGQIAPVVASQSNELRFLVSIVGGAGPIYDQLLFEENNNLQEMGLLPGVSNIVARASTYVLTSVSQKELYDTIGDFNNVPYWRQVTVPSLALFGEEDSNVDAKGTAAILESLQLPNLHVTIFPGSGHALEDPPNQGTSVIRHEALQQISTFIQSALE